MPLAVKSGSDQALAWRLCAFRLAVGEEDAPADRASRLDPALQRWAIGVAGVDVEGANVRPDLERLALDAHGLAAILLPFAQFEVAYFLTRRPNLRRQSDEREPLSLAKLFQAIRQVASLRRLSLRRRSNSLQDLAVRAPTDAGVSPTIP